MSERGFVAIGRGLFGRCHRGAGAAQVQTMALRSKLYNLKRGLAKRTQIELKPISHAMARDGAGATKAAASSPPFGALAKTSPETMRWALAQVDLFFGSFRKAEADDPKVFAAGCLRLFTAYSADAVRHVVDPETGLPGRSEWLPSLKAVRDALVAFEEQRRREQARRARAQAAQGRAAEGDAWEAKRAERPTFDELRARYGPNWGMKGAEAEDESAARKRQREQTEQARRFFERECARAGLPKDSPISPTLATITKNWKERGAG